MFESGLIHSTCIEQGKRRTSNMPDENFEQSENFCFPPNYFFIFTCFITFGVIFKSLNGVFRWRTYSKPLPSLLRHRPISLRFAKRIQRIAFYVRWGITPAARWAMSRYAHCLELLPWQQVLAQLSFVLLPISAPFLPAAGQPTLLISRCAKTHARMMTSCASSLLGVFFQWVNFITTITFYSSTD